MSTSAELFTIGQLARRTGVPARTIRFWSDAGLVSAAARSGSGYRLYDADAVARLDLVRTLRELGLGLDVVQAVLARACTVAEVAAAHVTVLDAQIRTPSSSSRRSPTPGWNGTGSCWPSSTASPCRRPWCPALSG